MIAFLQANSVYSLKESIRECNAKVHIYIGEMETSSIRKSAEDIHSALPQSTLQVLPKLYHGEFSINHGNDYAKAVRQIVSH